MTTHKPQELLFVTNNGLVKTDGYALNLAKGQFTIVDLKATPTNKGAKVVETFSKGKKDKFELRLGVKDLVSRSMTNRPFSSIPFKLSEVEDIKVSYPSLVNSVDEFIIGFDGVNENTALTLKNGETLTVDIKLSGEGIGLHDYQDSEAVFKLVIDAPLEGDFTMEELVENAVLDFKEGTKLSGDVDISTVVELTTVNSKNPETVTGKDYVFQTLVVKDKGQDTDLARVQAQYNDQKVKVKDFNGETTEYVVLTPKATVLPSYKVYEVDITLDCEEYDTSELKVIQEVEWIKGEDCKAVEQTYTITLADTVCGETREEELQLAFPELTIVKGESKACQTTYSAKVLSNVVCEECDPVFRDLFVSEAPETYMFTAWKKEAKVYSADALMGIRVKGKRTLFAMDESMYPDAPTFNDFIRVGVAAYTTSNNYLNFNERYNYLTPKVISLGSSPEGLGMNFARREKETFVYYNAIPKDQGGFANTMLGTESLLKPLARYVMYSVTISAENYSQSISQKHQDNVKYDIIAEVGRHKALEGVINKLAVASGLPEVKAYDGK